MGGQTELEKARKDLKSRIDYDVEMDGALWRLQFDQGLSEEDRDHLEWSVADWNDRPGEMYVAEGRERAWKGVVQEMD